MRFVKQLWWRVLSVLSRTPLDSGEGQDAEPGVAINREDPERESAPVQLTEQNDGPSSASVIETEAEPQVRLRPELPGEDQHRVEVPVIPDAPRLPSRSLSKPTGQNKTEQDPTRSARRTRSRRFEYWDLPAEAPVREPTPSTITASERSRLDAVLRTGPDAASAGAEELFMILGLDMGTSCTKAIVRLPFEAGEPAIVIPAPSPCRSGWRFISLADGALVTGGRVFLCVADDSRDCPDLTETRAHPGTRYSNGRSRRTRDGQPRPGCCRLSRLRDSVRAGLALAQSATPISRSEARLGRQPRYASGKLR